MSAMRRALGSLWIVAIVAGGCGSDDADDDREKKPDEPWSNPTPELLTGMPAELAVGETVSLLGNGFIEPHRGRVLLRIEGTFIDEDGDKHRVLRWEKAEFVDDSRLSWRMWPDVVFTEEGDELGEFVGAVQAVNQAYDTYDPVEPDYEEINRERSEAPEEDDDCRNCRLSEPLQVNFEIAPSLILRKAEPVDEDCGRLVTTTLENQGFHFEVKAIGFAEASEDEPLRFLWGFDRAHWKMEADGSGMIDPDALLKKEGYVLFEDEVREGSTSYIMHGDDHSRSCDADTVGSDWSDRGKCYVVKGIEKIGQLFRDFDAIGYTGITELETRDVEDDARFGYNTDVIVGVVDGEGNTGELSIPLEITRGVTLHYDGSLDRIVRWESPVPVTGCTPAGRHPRQLSYSNRESMTKERRIDWNFNGGGGTGLGFIRNINTNVSFGVDVGRAVSMTKDEGRDISSEVLPAESAVVYGQWIEFKRSARAYRNDACGGSEGDGEVWIEDWLSNMELATGHGSCDPLPKTHLPEAGPCRADCQVQYAKNPRDG